MKSDFAERLIEDFERGLMSRRQLAAHLIGLGADSKSLVPSLRVPFRYPRAKMERRASD